MLADFSLPASATWTVRRVHLDLVALGLALDGIEIELGPWSLRVPSLVVRPSWARLLRGSFEPVVSAPRFGLAVAAEDGPAALLILREWIDRLRPPATSLMLRGGQVRTADGQPLLRDLELELTRAPTGSRLHLKARQREGGRIDAHGRSDSTQLGAKRFDVYADEFATRDLRRWLALATGIEETAVAAAALPTVVTGRWHVRGGRNRGARHRFDLELRAGGAPEFAPADAKRAVARLSARATGSFAVGLPGPPGDGLAREARPAAVAGWAQLTGRLARLRTLRLSSGPQRLLVSGDVAARLSVGGPSDAPRLVASLDLGEAYVGFGSWFQKAAGTPARLELARDGPSAARAVRLRGELAELRAEAELREGGVLEATTSWLSSSALVALSPELEGRVRGGRARVVELRTGADLPTAALLEFDGLEFGGPRLPVPAVKISGFGRLEGRRLALRDLRTELGDVPFRLDLDARLARSDEAPRLRLRFAARGDTVELPRRAGTRVVTTEPAGDEALAGELPDALRAAAEQFVALLRRQRPRLAQVALEAGAIRATLVQAEGETLRDLRVELGLEELRLEVRRFAFRRRGRLHELRGLVDLNRFVPEFTLADDSRS